MDDDKLLQLQNEINDFLQKESEISKLLEEHIALLKEDLNKITKIIT